MSPGAQLCPAKLEPGNEVGIKGKRVFVVPEEPWAAVESPASAEDEDLAPFLFLELFRLPYSMKGAVHTLTCPGRCHSLISLMAFLLLSFVQAVGWPTSLPHEYDTVLESFINQESYLQ